MGIQDRDYYRLGPRSGSGLGRLRFVSFNTWLIILNVAVFVVGHGLLKGREGPANTGQRIIFQQYTTDQGLAAVVDRRIESLQRVQGHPGAAGQPLYIQGPDGQPVHIGYNLVLIMDPLEGAGHFSTNRAFFGLEVWRFITFQFLHSGFWHLFFNMFGLWVFGGMVEQALGFKRYAAFYLVCGVFGAISYLLLNLLGQLAPTAPVVLFHATYTPLVGASAGVFGVIIACAYIAPNAIVQLLFPPIPIPLKWFAYGYVAIAAFNLLTGGNNAGGDAAHLGGAAAGFFFIRNSHLLRDFFDVLGDSRQSPRRARGPAQAEVDRILAKVANEGLHSLSDAEKRVLREATESQRGS